MKELNQFETYLVHEFVEDYEDGVMSRRDMIHPRAAHHRRCGGDRDAPFALGCDLGGGATGYATAPTDANRSPQLRRRRRRRSARRGKGDYVRGERGDAHGLPSPTERGRRRRPPGREKSSRSSSSATRIEA